MTVVTTPKRDNRLLPRTELRQRIADAAIQLFRARGYERVTVDEIVARARVSKGAFFNFFPTKADVLLVYFHEVDARIAALRSKLDPRHPQPALEKFFVSAEALLRKEGPLIETLSRAIWANPALLKADAASAVRDRGGFTEFFGKAKACGTIDPNVDAVTAGDAIGDLWTGSILLWLALGRTGNVGKRVRPKLQLLFRGLNRRKQR